jgi:hypothetical protein
MADSMRPLRGRNNVYFGAFLGLVFPAMGFLLFYVFAFSSRLSLLQYWDFLFESGNVSSALSLAVITNLPVFFLNLWNNRYETVKGIVGSTIFYGILVFLFKLAG